MADLIEPVVLACAKVYLTTTAGEQQGYARVDSQFGGETWGNTCIPPTVSKELAPVTFLSLAAGRPDALVASPNSDTFESSVETGITSPLLAVIEAKGNTDNGAGAAVQRAITQAHAHLDEVNLAFAAVPDAVVEPIHHRLARELNVGLLGVTEERTVTLRERPRAVGASTTPETELVRFHARIGDDVPSKLKKNHPKNALGYALAMHAKRDTDAVCAEYVIGSVGDAQSDAEALGLVIGGGSTPSLTPRGREVVRTLSFHYGSVDSALETVNQYYGKSTRLIDAEPVMGALARDAILQYPPTQVLLETLEELSAQGNTRPRVDEVAVQLAEHHPEFAIDLFLSRKVETRSRALPSEEGIDYSIFQTTENYHTHTLFQYKAVLFHTGLVTTRGLDSTDKLDFDTTTGDERQYWVLETSLRD